MKPLDQWNAIKEAAKAEGPDLGTGLAKVALALWASGDAHTKVGHARAAREAFVASVVGAAVVDAQIEKLALSRDDKAYLANLNALAALEDLSQFTKSAGPLEFLAKHPAIVGSVLGGTAGAGFGAYADDENRLRGAVRFGLPGAIGGAMIGHGVHQMKAEGKEKALKATRDEEAHVAQQASLKAKAEADATRASGDAARNQAFDPHVRTKREQELHALELKRREAQIAQEHAKTDDIKTRTEVWRANNLKAPPPAPPPPPTAPPSGGSRLQTLHGALSGANAPTVTP